MFSFAIFIVCSWFPVVSKTVDCSYPVVCSDFRILLLGVLHSIVLGSEFGKDAQLANCAHSTR